MFGIGNAELLIILLIALLLFGSKQLPQVVKTMSKGMRDLQKMTQTAKDEIHKIVEIEDDQDNPYKS